MCVTGFILVPTLSLVLAIGLLAIFILLAALLWTRWGQARPISKCVVLSLVAHILLLIYACCTHIFYAPPGRWTGQAVRVRLHDAADDHEAAPAALPDALPWEQAGQEDVLMTQASAHDATEPPPDSTPASPADPPQAAEAENRDTGVGGRESGAGDVQPQAAVTAKTAPPAPPHDGLPDEVRSPQADQPQLTDLLPDHDATAGTTSDQAAVVAEAVSGNAAPPTTAVAAASALPPQQDETPTNRLPPASAEIPSAPGASQSKVPPAPRRLGDGRDLPEPLRARLAANRLAVAQAFGATPQTEAAVAAALDWLAAAQSPDGRWDADAFGAGRETRTLGHDRRGAGANADTGVSGLALLAFLGSGETHLEGKHRQSVQHGLEFLLASQAANGSLAGQAEFFAAMYCHGIATLALSEAHALSGDERLLPGLQKALQYTIAAQHSNGGWRYQPLDEGDMSQFGWQLMALKSAELGGIPIPPQTRLRMIRFLHNCSSGASRGLASYRPGDRVSRSMTAEALACRYFLAAENSQPAVDEAAAYLVQEPPGAGPANYYYWYYGTIALFQRQGEPWQRWNAALQQQVLMRQRWDGALAGSWDPDDLWGGYGGRIYSTSLAALSLEVYYRYLPLQRPLDSDSRLTDRPWLPSVPR